MKNTSFDNSRRKAAAAYDNESNSQVRNSQGDQSTIYWRSSTFTFLGIPRQTSSPTLPNHARLIANILTWEGELGRVEPNQREIGSLLPLGKPSTLGLAP